jgi:hypothetical protein
LIVGLLRDCRSGDEQKGRDPFRHGRR